ncbi:multi antimicrobial extrusion protein MatE [Gorillibacterium sp. sgz5001074]|uniref:multi antimicrobial extrusion protein MatE n=1 Tax=Gorillibacterium sp. sgz5001074 TaxID=3446695 RepID=UPI003F66AB92
MERANAPQPNVTLAQMFAFFIPLGLSSSLVTISHVIINGTLTRSAHPEAVLSSYAVAMSLLGITEKPAVLLRQTCSALVRDRISFRAISLVFVYLLIGILVVGGLVSYSDVGRLVFGGLYGASPDEVEPIMHVYRVLMFVSIFSGLRCLFHGVIIFNKRTLWLTLGMVVRLVGMYALSQYYLSKGVESGQVGAVIFLVGMVVEAVVAVWEGLRLYRKELPEKKPDHPYEKPSQIFSFYRPLLFSSFIAVIIAPAINICLGQTPESQRSIAAFALAGSVCQLVISFFSYLHQIVLNFYRTDARKVRQFTLLMAFIPTLLLGLLSFTPLGSWVMTVVLGAKSQLLHESLLTLRFFMIMTLAFTWLDYSNGLLMLRGETKVMVWSQASNVLVTVLILIGGLLAAPGLNSRIGVLAQSFGVVAELAVVTWSLRLSAKNSARIRPAEQLRG